MKKAEKDVFPFSQCLATFLLSYRTTPHATTNVAPCVLFLGRSVWTRLNMLTPDPGCAVAEKQSQQKQQHDQHSDSRHFCTGQTVWVRDFLGSTKRVGGTVSKRVGPLTT